MDFDTYEELWDVSQEFLEKHVVFVNTLTSLMLDKAKQLRAQVLSADTKKEATFVKDFTSAHDELQKMGKSLQCVVNDWKKLFAHKVTGLEDSSTPKSVKPMPCSLELTFDYIKPTLDYNENQKIKLMVTYVPSTQQGIFYAYDYSRRAEIASRLVPIQRVAKVPLAKIPPSGTVFLVHLDNIWHRAVGNVTNSDTTGATSPSAMYLLDLGETLTYESHFPIAKAPRELDPEMTIPGYAIKCAMTPKTDRLPFNQYDEIFCEVVAVEGDTLLVASCSAEPPKYAITRDTLTEQELQQLDELPQSTTNAMKAVLGYVPKDDAQLCKFYDPVTKRCFKGANCRMRHEMKDPDGWTLDKDTVSAFIPARLEDPQPDTFVTLLPTFIVDVNLFYAHIIGNETNDRKYEELMAKMNDPVMVAQYKPLKLMPALGELVLAKYEEVWYRATVCEQFESTVSVFYVDYGNTAMVGMEEVRRWEDCFKYLPYQAICCRIANIQRIKPFHVEALEQITESLLDKRLKAQVIDNKYPWDVQIFDDEGFNIGDLMIVSNLALPRTPARVKNHEAIPG
uniref:C3H1-type domain-containing protein n=1 Tax=Anopheles farauti TaxID=69004 RepID=A0A182QMP2_9DIPT